MKPLYRQPFELHYIHGYKVKEIAKFMDKTYGHGHGVVVSWPCTIFVSQHVAGWNRRAGHYLNFRRAFCKTPGVCYGFHS